MKRFSLVCLAAMGCLLCASDSADAQCATCAQPTVAYYQPAVAYQQAYTSYYPSSWRERRRLRRMQRWGYTPVNTYTAAYAPTAAYTPYTAAYAYTASYRPYVTAYAPLQRVSYTVSRPVVVTPVASSCVTCGCSPCSCSPCGCSSCSTCSACDTCSRCAGGVSQAIYSDSSSGCASCAAGTGTPSYSSQPSAGPQTPQPSLAPNEPVPGSSTYDTQRPPTENPAHDPKPVPESGEQETSTYMEAPPLFPSQDRTASRAPSVPVRQTVYTTPAKVHMTNHSSAPEVDANGWYAVPAGR